MNSHYLRLFLPLFYSLALLLSSCGWLIKEVNKDPAPKLPPETQEGKDTFGCLVNGKVWVNNLDLLASYGNQGFYVLGRDYKQDESIKIAFSSGITGPGDYVMYRSKRGDGEFYYRRIGSPHSFYETDSLTNGIVTITRLDPVQAIISGRFYFTGTNDLGQQVQVTNGRFDAKYRQ